VANLLPVPGWQSAHLAVDQPIAIAGALVLSPIEIGLAGFLGTCDIREFRGQLPLRKAAFNRSQISCGYLVASLVAHTLDSSPNTSAWMLPIAFAALTLIFIVNYLFVSTAISLEHGYPMRVVISRLRLGTAEDFGLTFLAWGVLGAMLAALHDHVHPWVLLAFLGPTLLTRQVLLRSQGFLDARRAYRARDAALARMASQISEERTDERRMIAADLHDEILQPLYKVQLMAHVLRADLATGRLLEMDDDLPQLLAAAEAASGSLRELIGDLRRSNVGRGGLARALASLVEELQRQTTMDIHTRLQEVSTEPRKELALYHVAREALANAVTHSRAKNVWLEVTQVEDVVRLVVQDDGTGFDPLPAKEGHFGMQIMKERAEAVGGRLLVETAPREGASLILSMPVGDAEEHQTEGKTERG
jgi:signal transduction histidine kinase